MPLPFEHEARTRRPVVIDGRAVLPDRAKSTWRFVDVLLPAARQSRACADVHPGRPHRGRQWWPEPCDRCWRSGFTKLYECSASQRLTTRDRHERRSRRDPPTPATTVSRLAEPHRLQDANPSRGWQEPRRRRRGALRPRPLLVRQAQVRGSYRSHHITPL